MFAPHVEALAQHMPEDTVDLTFAYLLGQLGFYHSTQARYRQALQAEQRVLGISEAALPAGHPNIALRLDNLAHVGGSGAGGGGAAVAAAGVGISEAALPARTPDIALRLDNLAYTLGDLGRPGEALPLRAAGVGDH